MAINIGQMMKTIEQLLGDKPATAAELAQKTGATVSGVREAISNLETQGKAVSVGAKPVRYRAARNPARRYEREDYRGEPMPYLRPGSYTPPSRPHVTLVGDVLDMETEEIC
ncbi:hypothetical protein [Acidithiobacillus sp.]|uniref:hypothetical protein n=1 Tax=Acidithiobacillus sp. TaxID=1872118 RepID=UPI003D03CB15